jgi:hypothetical protein
MAWSTSKSEILLHIKMIEKRGGLTERDKQLRKIGFHYTIPGSTSSPDICGSPARDGKTKVKLKTVGPERSSKTPFFIGKSGAPGYSTYRG